MLASARNASIRIRRHVRRPRKAIRLLGGRDNRFTEATLGKLRYLSGNENEANAIADRIIVNPPTESDPLVAAIEFFSFLGRDEDIVVLSEAASGDELAMKMAAADGSPTMLDALQDFAFGSRGPDAMRSEALNLLSQRGRIDAGPHRFYSRGKWTDIKLFMAEITWEATQDSSPWVQTLVDTGSKALSAGDFDLAEESFNRVLAKYPDNCSAAYNLCVVWLERDGEAGRQRARTRMEAIHEQFPDYLFAPISLAQFAAMDGDLDRARDLLAPISSAKRLHVTEATALFTAQAHIAIKRREFESAEQAWALLVRLMGEDDPKVAALRQMIDNASRRRDFRELLSGSALH